MLCCLITISFNVYGDHVFSIITLPRVSSVSFVLVIWYQSQFDGVGWIGDEPPFIFYSHQFATFNT
jgi:hypothetical protein